MPRSRLSYGSPDAFLTPIATRSTSEASRPVSHSRGARLARDPPLTSLRFPAIDTALFEKQQTFNRSKTRERIVHPCGSAAFGSFTVTNDVSKYTKADFLQPGTVTPVFTRFSTVTYGREFADSARNPRGMATKFYTTGGNYDLVGLNWPRYGAFPLRSTSQEDHWTLTSPVAFSSLSFFVREPFMGPDVIRSQQRNPRNFLIDYNAWFDFLANVPESNYSGALLLSDEGTPVGWKHMNGFGCHTFRWTNKEGGSVFVKYHWICQQEKKNVRCLRAPVTSRAADLSFAVHLRRRGQDVRRGPRLRQARSLGVHRERQRGSLDDEGPAHDA